MKGRGLRIYMRLARLALPASVMADARQELESGFTLLDGRARGAGVGSVLVLWVRLLLDLAWTGVAVRLGDKEEGTMGGMARAARDGFRTVVRRPIDRTVEIVTVGLGVAAFLVIAVVGRDVLMRPLPYDDPSSLYRLRERDEEGRVYWPSRLNFQDWRDVAVSQGIPLVAATPPEPSPVTVLGRAHRVDLARYSRGFFSVLGSVLEAGRPPVVAEGRQEDVALISHSFWERVLLRQDLDGLAVIVDGKTTPVVGVLAPDFGFLSDGGSWGVPDVFVPLERNPDPGARQDHGIHVVARVVNAAGSAEADRRLDAIAKVVAEEAGEPTHGHSVVTTPLADDLLGPARRPLRFLLFGAVAVFLVAILNVVGAATARALSRSREMAVRRALGATSIVLQMQGAAEALFIALPSAALGLVLATAGIGLANALDPASLPRLADVSVGWWDAVTALAAAYFACVVAGSTQGHLGSRPAERLRTARGGGVAATRGWNLLIVTQVAVTLALLTVSVAMFRTYREHARAALGYRPDGVVAIHASLPSIRYPDPAARREWIEGALSRARSHPDVTRASVTNVLPHVTQAMISRAGVPGVEDGPTVWSGYRIVDPDYFDVLSIPSSLPLPAGNDEAVLVDRAVADALFRGEDAVGRPVQSGMTGGPVRVGGVVGSIREWALDFGLVGAIYTDYRVADPPPEIHLLVRVAEGRPDPSGSLLRSLAALDPEVPVTARTLNGHIGQTFGSQRLVLTIIATFAVLGLLLAVVGVYGIVAYMARQKGRETGVRIALGAAPSRVRGSVMGVGIRPAVGGVLIGAPVSVGALALLESWVSGVQGADVATVLALSAFVVTAAACAGLGPAIRASRVDPVVILRED